MSDFSELKGKVSYIDYLISRRLKMRRLILGVSQQELAEAAEVSIQQVQKYESAINRISSSNLYRLAKFLKVPINYFFEQIDDNLNNSAKVAEEDETYSCHDNSEFNINGKEVASLIKTFGGVKNPQVRNKLVELIKSMSLI
jgi:transcriptional regulator with XRE-family HTH domain